MRCELYFYWRLLPADLPVATAAMRAFQQRQVLAVPGLQARLLQRADAAGDPVTLMETYVPPAADGGMGEALRQRIVEGGDAASAPWRVGLRHIEAFIEVGPVEAAADGRLAG